MSDSVQLENLLPGNKHFLSKQSAISCVRFKLEDVLLSIDPTVGCHMRDNTKLDA